MAKLRIEKTNIIDRHLGRKVRARRLALGLSQTALGQRLGVKYQQIQKYERGANRISASALYALSDALSMPVSAFFADLAPHAENYVIADPNTGVPLGDQTCDVDDMAALLYCFPRITSSRGRLAVVEILRVLSGEN